MLKQVVGDKWHEMRATLSPSFTSSKMKNLFCLIEECARNFTDVLSKKGDVVVDVELKEMFQRYGNDVIATAAFGIKCNSIEDLDNEFYLNGRRAFKFTGVWNNIKFGFMSLLPKFSKVRRNNFF